ncbi:hypothetical protein PTI98_007262 [Pleurotus ostreatus]|uniref:Uncharacterized protein n=1 Tax=Pleurotus ostreatus (strain PC15) TaxID=1137138 RepID=A0A067NJI8_PLEO1|nr:hypothetical protein PTI98_007262 [Pleurotus ostreatus]KDQ27180.1 hypothetical protein PLEOSDRAFT_1097399 [Pleurotus ostreatus PC15]
MSAPAPASTELPAPAAANTAPAASPPTGYTVEIKPHFRGAVRATTNSSGFQRATFTLIDKTTGREIASSVFIGHGARSPMALESNGAPVWKFVGRPETRIVRVFIEHAGSPNGTFTPSKLAKPVTIKKEPDDGHNEEYYFSVFLSEDWTDNDYDDGVVTITQWK